MYYEVGCIQRPHYLNPNMPRLLKKAITAGKKALNAGTVPDKEKVNTKEIKGNGKGQGQKQGKENR